MSRLPLHLAGFLTGLAAYAFLEPWWLEVRRVRLTFPGLHPALEGLRIGLLTDLHASRAPAVARSEWAAKLVMRERPDLIAVTGDLVSRHRPRFGPALDALEALHAPLGVYTVPGNHDHAGGLAAWQVAVAAHPTMNPLLNEARIVAVGGARLCIAGVEDFADGEPTLEPLQRVGPRDFTLLLAHNPDQAERARRSEDRVDLILSGHTHGGQIRLPFIGPLATSVDHDELYEEGVRNRPWTRVYTSRGVGNVKLPLRFGTRPEVTILELARGG